MDISKAEFERQIMGDFTPSQRDIDLHERLAQYYRDTPRSMSNTESRPISKAFTKWRKERGYTNDDVNRAKKSVQALDDSPY